MRIFYNVAHDGYLIKAIAHRSRYHQDDYAVFLINQTLYDTLDVGVFENTAFIHIDIYKFAMGEGELLKNKIVDYVDGILKKNSIEIKNFDEVYHLVDEVDLFGVFLESKRIPYIQLETDKNLNKRFYNSRPQSLKMLRERNSTNRSYDYEQLMFSFGTRHGGGKLCKYPIFTNETTVFPLYVTNSSKVARWDYRGILLSFTSDFLEKILALYRFSFNSDSKAASIISFASRLMITSSEGFKERGIVDNAAMDSEFILLYQLMADFFVSKEYDVYFKPHPREIKFQFSPYIDDSRLIPPAFPTELLPLIKHLNIKGTVSSSSSGGSFFEGDSHSVLLGHDYTGFYPYLIKLFVVSEVLKFSKESYTSIYISGLIENLTDKVLRQCFSENFTLFRLFSDIENIDNAENIALIINTVADNNKKNLLSLLKKSEANILAFFLSTDGFPEIFTDKNVSKYIHTIRIKKKPISKYCLAYSGEMNNEYIHVFVKNKDFFGDGNDFELLHELVYTKVNILASLTESFNHVKAAKGKVSKAAKNQGDGLKVKNMKKSIKFKESGRALSHELDYSAKIENGMVKVQLTGVPEDVCISFDLLRNLKVVDSLSPCFVKKASFAIKNFADYAVRFTFYDSSNLSTVKYRFDTAPLIYNSLNVVGTLNPAEYDFPDALDKLERLLFTEKQRADSVTNLLANISLSRDTGFSFADGLMEEGVSSLYFYCDESDWDFGCAIYNTLFADRRVEIIDCISEFSYDPPGEQHVKFTAVGSRKYKRNEVVLIVSCNPPVELISKFQQRGLRTYNVQEVVGFSLRYAEEFHPYRVFNYLHPNVELIFVDKPQPLSYNAKDSRSENENAIIATKVTKETINTWLAENPPRIPPALEECGTSIEQMNEYTVYTMNNLQSKNNGWAMPAERQGDFVNVKNGCRVTTDVPDLPKNKIYIFGSEMVYAPFASDDKTAASYLQRLLNAYSADLYEVVNCGGWSNSFLANMHRIMLRGFKYQDGDKVIIMHNSVPEFPSLKYKLIDISQIFVRPHKYGEIWVNNSSLISERGQEVIARGIFNGLKEQGLAVLKKR